MEIEKEEMAKCRFKSNIVVLQLVLEGIFLNSPPIGKEKI